MKKDIHPTYYPEATVVCACGNTWTTGSTVEQITTDVCSECHPFYTGEQRIVDSEGQVDRFYKKLQAREEYLEEQKSREDDKVSPELAITELELGTRVEGVLESAKIKTVGDVLDKLREGGDEAMLDIDRFGRKSLADVKRALRRRGYVLPEDEAQDEK
jgi:large subunit ribosomal protein L31